MSKKPIDTALVIGAGIVGVSTAYGLQKAGVKVTLVDREGPCAGTSYGNAGALVDAACVPNAMPGMWKTAFSMFMDPTGPLTVRWSYLSKIAPWLLRFAREAQAHRADYNASAFRALTQDVATDWLALANETALLDLVKDVGWLKVYDSDQGFKDTEDMREMMTRHNSDFEVLNQQDIRDLEPGLSSIFKHGIFQRQARFLLNPERMVLGIADAFKALGGDIVISDVHSLQSTDAGIRASGSGGDLVADQLVLCTGAWSKNLAGQFGAKIPLDTERGYHMMFPVQPETNLNRPVVYGEKSFVLAPMETGIRMTSQVEFAGLEKKPDYRRVRSLVPFAQKMLPGLKTEEKDVWLGYRPSLPDSLPIIGPSEKDRRVMFAFGHQHYGMTLGPSTAKLVCNHILGQPETVPLWPYRANRFS